MSGFAEINPLNAFRALPCDVMILPPKAVYPSIQATIAMASEPHDQKEEMMAVREKVNAQEFTLDTTKNADAIRLAGQEAIEAGKRFMTSSISESAVGDGYIHYKIKGPGGLREQMLVKLTWSDNNDGGRTVSLRVPSFMTVRQTVMFVPVTPKSAPALGSLKRFSAVLQDELRG